MMSYAVGQDAVRATAPCSACAACSDPPPQCHAFVWYIIQAKPMCLRGTHAALRHVKDWV